MKTENTKQSVIVVEDDPDIREAICEMLEFEGYPVVAFENGKEALERLHESPNPGLIILDLMMPVMNGIQFLRARQNDESLSDIPCFVVSAVGKQREIIREGAQGFLRKPVDANDILDIVKAHIHPDPERGSPRLLH
jgi:CheY-like chemotaxis protein